MDTQIEIDREILSQAKELLRLVDAEAMGSEMMSGVKSRLDPLLNGLATLSGQDKSELYSRSDETILLMDLQLASLRGFIEDIQHLKGTSIGYKTPLNHIETQLQFLASALAQWRNQLQPHKRLVVTHSTNDVLEKMPSRGRVYLPHEPANSYEMSLQLEGSKFASVTNALTKALQHQKSNGVAVRSFERSRWKVSVANLGGHSNYYLKLIESGSNLTLRFESYDMDNLALLKEHFFALIAPLSPLFDENKIKVTFSEKDIQSVSEAAMHLLDFLKSNHPELLKPVIVQYPSHKEESMASPKRKQV